MRSSNGAFKSFTGRPTSSGSPNFYFRRVLPRDLRAAFGRSEVRISLGTSDKRLAYQRWLMTSFLWLKIVEHARESLAMGKEPDVEGLLAALREGGASKKLERDPYNPNKIQITFDLRDESLEDVANGLMALVQGTNSSPSKPPADAATDPADGRVAQSATSNSWSAPRALPLPQSSTGLTFDEVAAKFFAVREGNWKPRVAKDYVATLKTIGELVGDVPFASLDEIRIARLKQDLLALPSRRNTLPMYRGRTARDAIELHQARVEAGAANKTISVGTFNTKYWQLLESLFRWAVGKYTDKNPASKMQINERKGGRRNKKVRLAFNKEDLQAIFEGPAFLKYQFDYQYWGPVLSYVLGTRVSEIGPIPLVAIKRSERGTVYIEFFEEHGFAAKTEWGERRVPIHHSVAGDLWSTVQRRRAKGEKYLLSSMYDDQVDPGRPISRYVNDRLLKRAGVKTKQKVEHSFRHGFINVCKNSRVDGGIIDELVGHTPNSTKGEHYEELTDIDVLGEIIDKVDFLIFFPPYNYRPNMDRSRPRRKRRDA